MSDETTTGTTVQPETRNIDVGIGAYVEDGIFNLSDQAFANFGQYNVITEETSTDVRGLDSPYIGLRNYTYNDSEIYAGREKIVAATIEDMTGWPIPMPLLFVTGASGSGKSSFVQAGLVPALEKFYAQREFVIRRAVFRPSAFPISRLVDGLAQLGLQPPHSLIEELKDAATFNKFIQTNTPKGQINLIVIDQFEELFIQSDPEESETLCKILSNLAAFKDSQTHIIATMRVDYLPELFEHRELYDLAKSGRDLRAMTIEELREAIQRPLQRKYPDGKKRFEPALVDRLAQETAVDAAYLPLLQIALEGLWKKGFLRLADYINEYSDLSGAIQKKADEIFNRADAINIYESESARQRAESTYKQDESGRERPQEEKEAILEIFLSLVNVSHDDNSKRDVRITRVRTELENKSELRHRMIEVLREAHLLNIRVETRDKGDVELVDIIHESLISKWKTLSDAIQNQRRLLQQRGRFQESLEEWLKTRSADCLIDGLRLAEARDLDRRHDVSTVGSEAQEFIKISLKAHDAKRIRRLRVLTGVSLVLLVLLVASIISAIFALQERSNANASKLVAQQQAQKALTAEAVAESNERVAKAQALDAAARSQFNVDPELGILLSMEAISTTKSHNEPVASTAVDTLRASLVQSQVKITLKDHKGPVNAVAFSHDGKYLVSGSSDGTAKIWDLQTNKAILTLQGHEEGSQVLAVAFSPDGKWVATGASDHTVRVWDAKTGKQWLILRGHTANIWSAEFSPDGKYILTGSDDTTVKIWDFQTGQIVKDFTDYKGIIYSARYSPDGKYIITASSDNHVKIWEIDNQKLILDQTSDALPYFAIFSPSEKYFAVGYDDKLAKIWNFPDNTLLETLKGHQAEVESIDFSPNENFVVTGSNDNSLIMWNLEDGSVALNLDGHSDSVESVKFSPDGKLIASGSEDGTIKLWYSDYKASRFVLQNDGVTKVYTAVFSPDDNHILTAEEGTNGDTATIWNAQTRQPQLVLKGHEGTVYAANYSPNGKYILTASADRTARLWDASTGQILLTLRGHTSEVADAEFSKDGKYIVTASDDETAKIWDATTGTLLQTFTGHTDVLNTAVFSPNGKNVLTASDDGTAKIWDVTTGKMLLSIQGFRGETITSADFSPDGKTIVICSGKKVELIDAATGKVLRDVGNYNLLVTSAIFSPDGKYLAVSSQEPMAHIWDVQTGASVATLPGHYGSVNSIAFSPDAATKWIVTASDDGTAQMHLFNLNDLLQLAQKRTQYRQLTDQERNQFDIQN